jgi:hypothetical protein
MLENHPDLRPFLDQMLKVRRGAPETGKAPTALEAYAEAGMTRYVVKRLEERLGTAEAGQSSLESRVGNLERRTAEAAEAPLWNASADYRKIVENLARRIITILTEQGVVDMNKLRIMTGAPPLVVSQTVDYLMRKQGIQVDVLGFVSKVGRGQQAGGRGSADKAISSSGRSAGSTAAKA